MKGIDIFVHAVRMVLNNLGAAVRISAVLMLVQFAVMLALGTGFLLTGEDMSARMTAGGYPFGGAFVSYLVMVLAGLWLAVAWHRFVLREEMPAGPVPPFHGGAIAGYFVAGLILALVLIAVAIPFALLGGLVVGPMVIAADGRPGIVAGFLMFVLVYLPVAYIGYRLSPVLPSAALETRMPLKEAWYATGTAGADFVVLTVVTVVAGYLVGLPAALLAGSAPLVAMVLGFLANWIAVLVGASILTTIYGHYVEKRALNV